MRQIAVRPAQSRWRSEKEAAEPPLFSFNKELATIVEKLIRT